MVPKGAAARRVIVAGGGIGGLSTALGLARKGVPSIVLEQSARLGEIGAGIQLGPNAFHAFDYLGVAEAARARAVFIDRLVLMDAVTAEEIVHLPLDEPFRQRFGNPYAVVHRGDLYTALLEGCQGSELVELRTDARVTGYAQDGGNVRALLSGGETVEGAGLIGADGLRSAIRAQMLGDGAPRVSGHTTYRSVIPTEKMPEALRWNAATLWAGPKCHIVHYPLSGWKLFNLVVTYHNDAAEPAAGKPVSKDEVRRGFEHIAALPRSIIEHGEDWKLWVLCDREPTDAWVDGRVALLGDAAHPMLQYMAQGACMAMEDAVCLAEMVDSHDRDLERAFAAYRDARVPRTARVQLGSRAMGEHVYHPAGPHAQVRNRILRAWSVEEFYDRVAWLYGGTGLSNTVAG